MPAALRSLLTRTLRRLFPSVSSLTYYLPVKLLLNLADLPPRLMGGRVRPLPPNHLRVRVGVGWRLFNNAELYTDGPAHFWLYALSRGWVSFGSTIVDIGTGCGRYASFWRDYRFGPSRFTGTYIGIDVDREMLDWCQANFPVQHFRYHHSPHQARSYGRPDANPDFYRIAEADGTADFVFSTSLFTHLLETELTNYVTEGWRLLKPGGWLACQSFVIERPPPTFGFRHRFSHRLGQAWVESLSMPEAAVAYNEAYLLDTLRAAGFTDVDIVSDKGDWQCLLVGRKPPQA